MAFSLPSYGDLWIEFSHTIFAKETKITKIVGINLKFIQNFSYKLVGECYYSITLYEESERN